MQVASQYRVGGVFLAGDAAHRFPPTGGLGLNTGVAEVDDLVRRLVQVVSGRASDELLDGYEATCRPVAIANAAESFENMKRLGEVTGVLGSCVDLAALEQRLVGLDRAERAALRQAIDRQATHFLSDGLIPDAASVARQRPMARS